MHETLSHHLLTDAQRLNHTANENRAKNDATYKRWLSTFSPLQVKAANTARSQLRRQAKKDGKKKTYPRIQDERLVKQPRNAYSFFLSARVASGDLNNMKVSEVGGLVGREWKSLSASDKKVQFRRPTSERRALTYIDRRTMTWPSKTRVGIWRSSRPCTG